MCRLLHPYPIHGGCDETTTTVGCGRRWSSFFRLVVLAPCEGDSEGHRTSGGGCGTPPLNTSVKRDPDDLRHTCASMLIAAGAHPGLVREHVATRTSAQIGACV